MVTEDTSPEGEADEERPAEAAAFAPDDLPDEVRDGDASEGQPEGEGEEE